MAKKSFGSRLFDVINVIIMIFIIFITLYPFLNALAISLNDADDTVRGGITFYPRVFTLQNYKMVFTNPLIYNAYGITIARTIIGTITALLFTGMLAFGLSHRNLKGRSFYTVVCLITMFFGGGLMPTYFLIRALGLVNTFWVYIIPSLVGVWNMMLMRTYFQGIPDALEESALIDGANYFTIFFRIILPVSKPIIATVALFIAVGHWNSWFDAAIYVTDQSLKPAQNVLLAIISEAKFAEAIAQSAGSGGAAAQADLSLIGKGKRVNVRSITMATMIVTALPIMMVYPFIQRYFIEGIMIGSLKG